MDHQSRDPDLLIPTELSQAWADVNLNQDLRGNLSVMSPRESHQSEETLPTVPLGQFQAQRSDSTTTNNIAHFHTDTPSQSKIFFDHNNSSTINKNVVTSRTSTPSQREIFSETGTGTSFSEDVTHSNRDMSGETQIQWEVNPSMRRPATVVFIPGPQHPSKVKYFLVTITDLISVPAQPPKVK